MNNSQLTRASQLKASNKAGRLNPKNKENSGLTEIVLPEEDVFGNEFVFQMLAHLSQNLEQRWFTWIAPPANITKELLLSYGFDTRKLRLIHTSDKSESLWVFWDALNNGNSATVVTSLGPFNEKDMNKLESASINGQCRGLILRARSCKF